MSNPTPGPWQLVTAAGCAPMVIKPGVHDICKMSGSGSHAGVIADARLIAAAPELLDALQNLLDMDVAYQRGPAVENAVEFASAAIAKATGEQQ